jgi:hypothetical protein
MREELRVGLRQALAQPGMWGRFAAWVGGNLLGGSLSHVCNNKVCVLKVHKGCVLAR